MTLARGAGPVTDPPEDVDDEAAALGADWGGARRRRATGPRLGMIGWLRWGWRQLTSMRTALVLLFLLAVAAIPGSVLPQRATDPLAVTAWIDAHPGSAATLDRLGMFDVFASPWFSAIYLLLFVSLIGCVLPRVAAHWRAMRAPTPPAPRRLDRLPHARTWTTADPGVLAAAATALRSERWRVTPGPQTGDATGSLAAERGFARETGNLVFHIALVLILVGVALGALLGWKGTVIVREGTGFANTLTQYDTFSPGRLATGALPPFSFTLSDFDVTFESTGSQRGAPRSFAAALAYRPAPDAPVEQRVVSVNSPLRVAGAKVFLVGHGYAPHLRLTDSTGRVVFDDTVVFLPQDGNFTSTGVLKAPDAQPQIGVQALFLPTAAVNAALGPHSTFPAPDDPALFASAFTGDLGLDSGVPRSIYSLDTADLEQLGLAALRPGDSWDLPDGQGSLELVGYERWASFTISHDPGKLLALAAAVLAIVGVSLSLFVRRRRIWVRVSVEPGPGARGQDAGQDAGRPAGGEARGIRAESRGPADPGTGDVDVAYRVQVAGLSRTESADIGDDVARLVAHLGGPVDEEGR